MFALVRRQSTAFEGMRHSFAPEPALVTGSGKNPVSTRRACFLLSQPQGAFVSRWRSPLDWWSRITASTTVRLTGSCPRLIVPRTRLSTVGDPSFRATVAQAWNSLSTNVTASTSLPSFKRQLKTFFYQIFPITLNCFLIFVYRVLEATLPSLRHVNQYVLLLLLLHASPLTAYAYARCRRWRITSSNASVNASVRMLLKLLNYRSSLTLSLDGVSDLSPSRISDYPIRGHAKVDRGGGRRYWDVIQEMLRGSGRGVVRWQTTSSVRSWQHGKYVSHDFGT